MGSSPPNIERRGLTLRSVFQHRRLGQFSTRAGNAEVRSRGHPTDAAVRAAEQTACGSAVGETVDLPDPDAPQDRSADRTSERPWPAGRGSACGSVCGSTAAAAGSCRKALSIGSVRFAAQQRQQILKLDVLRCGDSGQRERRRPHVLEVNRFVNHSSGVHTRTNDHERHPDAVIVLILLAHPPVLTHRQAMVRGKEDPGTEPSVHRVTTEVT